MKGSRSLAREVATLIILVGGESRRMGWPKHLLPTPYGTLHSYLNHRLGRFFAETLVVGKDLPEHSSAYRSVLDSRKEQSPLVGIMCGLAASETDLCFVLACDLPFTTPDLVSYVLSLSKGWDVVVPVVRGHYEPLIAAYRKSTCPIIESHLDQGILKVSSVFRDLAVREVPERDVRRYDRHLSSFTNLNVPPQLRLLSSVSPPGDASR